MILLIFFPCCYFTAANVTQLKMSTIADDLATMAAEWNMLCGQLRLQNVIINRADPETIAAMRRKVDTVLRIQALTTAIQQAAKLTTEPQAWACYTLSGELVDEEPRATDYGGPVQTQAVITRPLQQAPKANAQAREGWTMAAENAMWSLQNATPTAAAGISVGLLRMQHHATDSPNMSHEQQSTTSSMNRN